MSDALENPPSFGGNPGEAVPEVDPESAIEDAGTDLLTFLSTRVQEHPVLDSLRPQSFYIARTDCVGESVLDPISLEEWKKAISSRVWNRSPRPPISPKKRKLPGYFALITTALLTTNGPAIR